jgi:hypothetical protein
MNKMPDQDFTELQIDLDKLILDIQNPRFASYFNRNGGQTTNNSAIKHLITNAAVIDLAKSIRSFGRLYPAESIVCVKENSESNRYIVLEGNRRVSACKLLHAIFKNSNYEWVTQNAKNTFSDLEQSLINNISILKAVVYNDRSAASPYIISKHNGGIKEWSSEEKNFNYYKMFQEIREITPNKAIADVVEEIIKQTNDKKSAITNAIKRYSIFDCVFNSLSKENKDKVPHDVSFLPLVDVFMKYLTGRSVNDDYKLNIEFDKETQNYVVPNEKRDIFKKILALVGEAFLVRNTDRITTPEISGKGKSPRDVINDTRIPGLLDLIKEYKETPVTAAAADDAANKNGSNQDTPNETDKNTADTKETTDSSNNKQDDSVYEPEIPWKPKKPQQKYLGFSKTEGESFSLSDTDDIDVKVTFVIRELSRLSVAEYPYSCTSLYRVLLEVATKKAFIRKKPKEKGEAITYDKKNLAAMIKKLSLLLMTDGKNVAERANVIDYIDKKKLIDTLNNYMHNPKIVDTDILLNSWITMKEYIKACLQIDCRHGG